MYEHNNENVPYLDFSSGGAMDPPQKHAGEGEMLPPGNGLGPNGANQFGDLW